MTYNVFGGTLNLARLFDSADMFAVPDENRIDKRAGLIVQEFKSLMFSADYQPGAKRKVIFNCVSVPF